MTSTLPAGPLSSPSRRPLARWLSAALIGLLGVVGLSTAPATAAPGDDCPCSLFSSTDVPLVISADDSSAVELGMQFRSSIDTVATGIKFFKAAQNTGPHVGSLWRADGTLVGRLTFTDESDSGWQLASFAEPVPLVAGTTYVVSYHAPEGHYSYTGGFFGAGGIVRGVLSAPGGGSDNGLFAYSTTPTFPTGSFNGLNYWVDVVVGRPAPTVTSLDLTAGPTSLAKGQTRQLQSTATLSDGRRQDVTGDATWTTSRPGVVTVDATGKVTATGVGTATVSAAYGARTASVTFTVGAAVQTGLTISPSDLTLRPLASTSLAATLTYSDGSTKDVTNQATWTSSRILVASVSTLLIRGRVSALLPGTAVVRASYGSHVATTEVVVRW